MLTIITTGCISVCIPNSTLREIQWTTLRLSLSLFEFSLRICFWISKLPKAILLLVCRSDRRGSRLESCETNIYLIVFQHLWMNSVKTDSKCRYFGLCQVCIVLIHEGSQAHHCPVHLRKPALYSFGLLICKLINCNSLTLECWQNPSQLEYCNWSSTRRSVPVAPKSRLCWECLFVTRLIWLDWVDLTVFIKI